MILMFIFKNYIKFIQLIFSQKKPPKWGVRKLITNYDVDLQEPGRYLVGIAFVAAGPHFHS